MGILRQLSLTLLVATLLVSCSSEKNKRLQWNLETTIETYEEFGKRDPKWDDSAKEALTLFANWRADDSMDSSAVEKIAAQTKSAVNAGCKDAMLLYLYARFVVNQPGHGSEEIARAHQEAARKIKDSDYPPLRKFHAYLRTGEALNKMDTVSNLAVAEIMNDAEIALAQSLEDDSIPYGELYQAARAYMRCYEKMSIPRQGGWHQLNSALQKKWGAAYEEKLVGGEVRID